MHAKDGDGRGSTSADPIVPSHRSTQSLRSGSSIPLKEGRIVAPDAILGRTSELAVVARFFDRDASGTHGLLIEGEAGIGKTTVWREAVRIAGSRGRVLTSRASETEARLSFTVLGDLLAPVLDEDVLAHLPSGQRGGLEVALLLAESTRARPDARAVSLAVLAVLRVLAQEGPVTVAVDDVQWVDAPSARTLEFAIRRLHVEPVTVVSARRLEPGSGYPPDLVRDLPGGFERISLGPLDEVSLGRLLRRHLERQFPPPLVKRIHEETRGNPFFAIEVGRFLGDETPSLRPGKPLPVPRDLEALLHGRLSQLSAGARTASLIIAASPVPSREVVEAAGASAGGIQAAAEAGIVTVQGARLEFTHPLLASTVYGTASAGERRRVHARLAEGASDLEERARHLALSTVGTSEEVASALDDAALHAEDRGAPLAAAALFELATKLTPRTSDRIRIRHRAACANLVDAGDGEGAREMVERLLRELEPGTEHADVLRTLAFMSWNDVRRVSELLAEALDEVGDDPFTRAMILSEMAWAAFQGCHLTVASDLARSALALVDALPDPLAERMALSIHSTAEAVLGRSVRGLIDRAVALERTFHAGEQSGPSICLGRQMLWAGEVEGARGVLETALERFLDQGRETAAWEIIRHLAEVECRAGRWDLATHHAGNALEIARETGRGNQIVEILPVKAMIAAAIGQTEQARADGLEALSMSERFEDRWNEVAARSALGFLEWSMGDPAATHAWLAPAAATCAEMGLREPGVFPFVPDEVEALVALGRIDEAEGLTDRLDEQGRELGRSLALATASRCRGLISGARGELEAAVDHLDRALEHHNGVEHPFEMGRTQLVAGEVQRRMKRKRAARELLEMARSNFDELGAPMWAARARAELARVGGRPPAPDGLTPTEWQVAELVSQGGTNRQVADALFMSPKTVEAHLRRIYQILGVRSRTEMAHRLKEGTGALAARISPPRP